MRLRADTWIKVQPDDFDNQWAVLLSSYQGGPWLNVPVTFSTEAAAKRVAEAIMRERPAVTE